MRIVVAVDWSDETFAAVQAIGHLYAPQELDLVHAVDMTAFESPIFAPHIAKQAYQELRESMIQSGQQLLEQTSALLPPDFKSVRKLCEVGSPAETILDTAKAASADLVVLGTRSRGRLAELVLGSVSHQVLLHAPCSTLLVKRPLRSLKRVLIAVEGQEDATRLQDWLRCHPFTKPVQLTVLHVLPNLHFGDPAAELTYMPWVEQAEQSARDLVTRVKAELKSPHYLVTTEVLTGFPAHTIADASAQYDLVIVGSHGRTGVGRFLLGSVSHAIVHRVACSILVVHR